MDHNTIRDQLFALYDGELTGPPRRAVEDHLFDCAECRAVMAQWQHVAGALFPSPACSASEVFVQRVMRRIAAAPTSRFQLLRRLVTGGWLIPAMGMAALLLVMVREPLQPAISIENLLFWDRGESVAAQQILDGESPGTDDVLGLLMEEAS